MEISKDITLYKWLDEWMEIYTINRVKESTYKGYQAALVQIKQHIKDVPVSTITEMYVQTFLNDLYDCGYAKSTIKTAKIVLNQVYKKAIKNRLAVDNPAEDVYVPRLAPVKKINPLTTEEQYIVEMACQSDLHGRLFIFLLYTGLRRSELCSLKWTDYNKRKKTISIRESKTVAGVRIVPLLPACVDIIENQPKFNEHIFNSTIKKPITPSVLKKTYYRLRKVTGIRNITNHVCRHSFATRLLENGATSKAVSTLLGHTSVVFTQNTYMTAQYEYLRNEVLLLDKIKHKNHPSNPVTY